MHEYRDLAGITRAASIAVWAYMAAEAVFGMASIRAYVSPAASYNPEAPGLVEYSALTMFLTLIVSVVLVGRWTYRASANAHALSDEMTISPGWAVGWYFVPFANLIKPFQAMKETWLASHYRGNWHGEPTPQLLSWWWGLWILTNILSNISMQTELRAGAGTMPSFVPLIDAIAAILNVPLCVILVRMMKQLGEAQRIGFHNEAFA